MVLPLAIPMEHPFTKLEQIPTTARSLTYVASGAILVAFNGQLLPSIAISREGSYPVWEVDIAAYTGQSGELRFTSPWLTTGGLDDIRFSSTAIPEPSVLALGVAWVC